MTLSGGYPFRSLSRVDFSAPGAGSTLSRYSNTLGGPCSDPVVSIQKRSNGLYLVRWREAGKHRGKSFSTLRDAKLFESDLIRKRRLGELATDATRETLAELKGSWWESHVEPHLAATTRESYGVIWRAHIEPALARHRLSELTPDRIERFMVELRRKGVGEASIRRSLAVLSAILGEGVARGHLLRNPVERVRKPPKKRKRSITALSPVQVEAIRSELGQRDACIVSVLAYAGLRPGECFALRWCDVGTRTILVDASKTGRRRNVELLSPLKSDLLARKLASGARDNELVFPIGFRNWRRRVFAEAAPEGVTPYTLRHSFASLLLASGRNPVEVAGQMGHGLGVLLSTYSHVIDEFRGSAPIDPEAAIRAARDPGSARRIGLRAP